jgi:Flp pilus assembly protein TadG
MFLRNDCRGSVIPIIAIAIFVLMGSVGSAIDLARVYRVKVDMDAALDAAVLAAAQILKDQSAVTLNSDRARVIAKQAMDDYFETNLHEARDYGLDVEVSMAGFTIEVAGTYDTVVDTAIMKLFHINEVPISNRAVSTTGILPFVDVTLVVDTSASMALGASKADIDRLRAQFGCAFACHEKPGYDSYTWAKNNGVKLRYDLIREAVLHFADFLESFNSGGRVQVQLYSFDNTLKQLTPLMASMKQVRENLPTAPVTSDVSAGGTRFWEYKNKIALIPNKSGDGSTRGKAIQMMFILTDGVQDPSREWTSKVNLRSLVREFDFTVCDDARKRGVMVGVVHTPYMPMDWDWGYNATLGQPSLAGNIGNKRIDDVTWALKKCGSNLYLSAEHPEDIITSFEQLFTKASPTRLVY